MKAFLYNILTSEIFQIIMNVSDEGMPFDPTQNIINIDDYDIEEQVGGLGRYIAVNNVDEAEKIVLDFDKTEYLSSSGLRQIVAIHKKAR